MLVTSGLLYAIVPSGATLALRVLSSIMKTTFKDPDENEEDVMPTVDNDLLYTLLNDV